jgi:hypothetical protein
MTIKMSQLDPRIQVYLFQIINDVFWWNCINEFFEWNYTIKSITGLWKNHDIQEENAWQ